MLESVRNIFAIPDLRKRLAFTFGLLAVYRIGCHIPTPGVDPTALIEFMTSVQNTFLGFVNTFTGGSLQRVAVFALGIILMIGLVSGNYYTFEHEQTVKMQRASLSSFISAENSFDYGEFL